MFDLEQEAAIHEMCTMINAYVTLKDLKNNPKNLFCVTFVSVVIKSGRLQALEEFLSIFGGGKSFNAFVAGYTEPKTIKLNVMQSGK